MSSGTKIVKAALRLIGAHSIAAPADPESITIGTDTLNSMIQSWLSIGIDMGATPLQVPGDELNEPVDAYLGIVYNLAMLLQPNYGAGGTPISPLVVVTANSQRDFIKSAYQVHYIPSKVVSSTLPKGQGNVGYRDRQYFAEGETLDG
jgi:hypothetical protein